MHSPTITATTTTSPTTIRDCVALPVRITREPAPPRVDNARSDVAVTPEVMRQSLLSMGLNVADLPAADLAVLDRLPAEALGVLQTVAKTAAGLTTVESNGSGPRVTDLQAPWADVVSGSGISEVTDINALVQWVLREAYISNCEDMYYYAQKVRFYNELKKQIRAELTKARELLSFQAGRKVGDPLVYERTNDDGTVTQFDSERSPYRPLEFNTNPVLNEETGKWEVGAPTMKADALPTKETLTEHITDLEEQLSSVGDDAQLANVDLQNMLQKQQQTLQLMSNISKMLHDTAMAIIRKIGS